MRVVLSVHTLPYALPWKERFYFPGWFKDLYTIEDKIYQGLYFNNSNLTDLFNRKYDENEIRNI